MKLVRFQRNGSEGWNAVAGDGVVDMSLRFEGKYIAGDRLPQFPSLFTRPGFTPLATGDVVSMGTPDAVGLLRQPPPWLRPGDVVEIEVETPTKLTAKQKDLLEQFRATETGAECPASEGFFGKIKGIFGE